MDAAFEKALLGFLVSLQERQVKILNTIPISSTPSTERTLVVRFDVPTAWDGFLVYNAVTDSAVNFAAEFATRGLYFTNVQTPVPILAANGGAGGYPWLHTMSDAQTGLYATSEQTTDTVVAAAGRRILRRLGIF